MSKTVFNRDEADFTKEPMFFGADQNVQRYDVFKYPAFDKLNQTMTFLQPKALKSVSDLIPDIYSRAKL